MEKDTDGLMKSKIDGEMSRYYKCKLVCAVYSNKYMFEKGISILVLIFSLKFLERSRIRMVERQIERDSRKCVITREQMLLRDICETSSTFNLILTFFV